MNETNHIDQQIESDLSNLAAEYALGLLRGRDRQRFELLMAINPALKTFVLKWTGILSTLEPRPVATPESAAAEAVGSMWDRLESRLDVEEQVMTRLHEHPISVRASLAVTIGALRVLRERLDAQRRRLDPAGSPVPAQGIAS